MDSKSKFFRRKFRLSGDIYSEPDFSIHFSHLGIGNSLIDLMLIAMYEDEHEFDYEMLRVYVAEHIWPYKKAWAELASKFLSLNIVA